MKNTEKNNFELFATEPEILLEVKPFLKWAGGKSQLLVQFEEHFPKELKLGKIENYYEPFLGGGAVFFHVAQKYQIKKAFLYDINDELIITYNVIKEEFDRLIKELEELKKEYLNAPVNKQEEIFYTVRTKFNQNLNTIDFSNYSHSWIERAAQIIFLNKTCFNGLFRLNKKGEFNVPFGKFKNPGIFDYDNLLGVSRLLQLAQIEKRNFNQLPEFVKVNSFIYFDPPYRPLNKTSNFTSYSKFDFTDKEQIELAKLFKELAKKDDIKLMLSNADPHNEDPTDNFFIQYYSTENINIQKVFSNRKINSDVTKRGKITELIIKNYF